MEVFLFQVAPSSILPPITSLDQLLIVNVGLPTVGTDPEKERRPPADPTPLDFPVYDIPSISEDDSESPANRLYGLLTSIKRPQDITAASLKALNLKLETDIAVSNIVPEDRMSSLPSLPWEDAPSAEGEQQQPEDHPPALMSNGYPYPQKSRYEVVRNELLYDNDDAFREVVRLSPRPGRQRIRLTQSRNFWVGLERMSQYWDSSLDNYYERPASPKQAPADQAADKMQTDGQPQEDNKAKEEDRPKTPMELDHPASSSNPSEGPNEGKECKEQQEQQQQQQPEMVTMYTGRRIGSGSEMPDEIRDDAIRGFLEMSAWPFGCQVSVPSLPPRLAVKNLLFPVRQSFHSGRSPRDRMVARKGVLEGPVLIAQCRPDTTFRGPDDAPGSGSGEVCDILREVGAMLLAAEERAREGKTEVKPGEGKWWTTTPRWGGAPNDDVGDTAGSNSDEKPVPESGNARKRSKYEHPLMSSRRSGTSRKLSNAEKWKLIQPGPSLWDKRMVYMQIGKAKESLFDDVCMLRGVWKADIWLLTRYGHRYTWYRLSTTTSRFSTFECTAGMWSCLAAD